MINHLKELYRSKLSTKGTTSFQGTKNSVKSMYDYGYFWLTVCWKSIEGQKLANDFNCFF